MTLLLDVAKKTSDLPLEERKREIYKKMVLRGQQVPLEKIISKSNINKIEIKHHVISRFKQRFEKLYDIEIENIIKHNLNQGAIVVGAGHSDRWQVYSKGMILIMDENAIYTTYDATGRDRNNTTDPTKAKLRKINRKTREQRRLDYLFSKI